MKGGHFLSTGTKILCGGDLACQTASRLRTHAHAAVDKERKERREREKKRKEKTEEIKGKVFFTKATISKLWSCNSSQQERFGNGVVPSWLRRWIIRIGYTAISQRQHVWPKAPVNGTLASVSRPSTRHYFLHIGD